MFGQIFLIRLPRFRNYLKTAMRHPVFPAKAGIQKFPAGGDHSPLVMSQAFTRVTSTGMF